MPKKKTAKTKIANAPQDKLGHAVAAYLDTQGWDAHVVGPCEVRTVHGIDRSGTILQQYEFVAKFYGRKTPVPCADR